MEESGGAGYKSDRDEKEDIKKGIPFYVDEYNQSGVDVSELRVMEGSGGAERESDRDEKKDTGIKTFFYADEYD